MPTTFKSGAKVRITIVLDAEVVTDLDSVTDEQLVDTVLNDKYFMQAKIVVSKCDPKTHYDHDTELLFESSEIKMEAAP